MKETIGLRVLPAFENDLDQVHEAPSVYALGRPVGVMQSADYAVRPLMATVRRPEFGAGWSNSSRGCGSRWTATESDVPQVVRAIQRIPGTGTYLRVIGFRLTEAVGGSRTRKPDRLLGEEAWSCT